MQQAIESKDGFFLLYYKKWSAFFSDMLLSFAFMVFGTAFFLIGFYEDGYVFLLGGIFFLAISLYLIFLSTKLLDDDVYKSKRVVLHADKTELKLGLNFSYPLICYNWNKIKKVILAEKVVIKGNGSVGFSSRRLYVFTDSKSLRGKSFFEKLKTDMKEAPNGEEFFEVEYMQGSQDIIMEHLQTISNRKNIFEKYTRLTFDYKKCEIIGE